MILLLFACTGKQYGKWNVSCKTCIDSIPWAKFTWISDSVGGRFFERYAINIPAKIKGSSNIYSFQFDLGANITRLYAINAKSLTKKFPDIDIDKPEITFGPFKATTPLCYIQKDYGEQIDANASDTPRIGTIGSDLFQNKVLIIDYPNQRFSICDSIPRSMKGELADMHLDKYGRVILYMYLKGKQYDVMFDNGSSIFPLKTSTDKISVFSTGSNTDTIVVNAWGKMHLITGRPLKDTLTIAGRKLSDITVYEDLDDTDHDVEFDAITGNALFWNNIIIIDFKHKKFGIR